MSQRSQGTRGSSGECPTAADCLHRWYRSGSNKACQGSLIRAGGLALQCEIESAGGFEITDRS